jgi:hypothetical protein
MALHGRGVKAGDVAVADLRSRGLLVEVVGQSSEPGSEDEGDLWGRQAFGDAGADVVGGGVDGADERVLVFRGGGRGALLLGGGGAVGCGGRRLFGGLGA